MTGMQSELRPVLSELGWFLLMNNHLETMFKEKYRECMRFDQVREALERRAKASLGRQQEELEDSLLVLLGAATKEAFADKHRYLATLIDQLKQYRIKRNAHVHFHVKWNDGRWEVSHPDTQLQFTEDGLRRLGDEALRLEGDLRVAFTEALGEAALRVRVRAAVVAALSSV